MPLPTRWFPYPVGKMRLFSAVVMAILTAAGFYVATINYQWLTWTRISYLVFGVAAGLFLGSLEPRLVLAKLSKNAEATVWQPVVLNVALIVAPLLLVMALFGNSEYLPFIFYAFIAAPVYFAVSGLKFSRFEDENQVNVNMFYYGFTYWKQPNPDAAERFHCFLRNLAHKDTTLFWADIGYAKIFLKQLNRDPNITEPLRSDLERVLSVMNKYRVRGLACFAAFMLAIAGFMTVLFSIQAGVLDWRAYATADVLGVTSLIIFVGFAVGVFGTMHMFKRSMAKAVETLDTQKLSTS